MRQYWKPIESAPTDGTFVLLGDFNYATPAYLIGRWDSVLDVWRGESTRSGRFIYWREATHWQPLQPAAGCYPEPN